MANLVISGDTSGSVTLAAPAISGSTVLTLPTTTGTLVVTGGAQTIEFAAGLAAAPSITFTGDTNTGIFSPGADTIAFAEGGVESMRIDSSGNVGIGVAPSAWSAIVPVLQIGGGGAFLAGLGSSPYVALGTNAHYNGTNFIYKTTNTATYYDQSSGLHRWYTAGPTGGTAGNTISFTQAMTLDASGNVGIGVTPTARLGITTPDYSASATNGMIRFQNPNVAADSCIQSYYVSSTGSDIYIGANAYVNTSGNSVRFSNSYAASAINVRRDGDITFQNNSSAGNPTERMRITSGGSVLVGTTSTINSERFAVKGPAGDANNWLMTMQSQATTQSVTMIAFYDGSNTFCGQIYIDAGANVTYYATSSDYRLKENVAPMTGALAKVQQLNPVTYNWKKSGKESQGFIAHELQEVIPEAVIGEKDAVDKDGNIMPQMIDTSFLVATLTAAIQEQQQIINDLKLRIETLENK
jgi:hypothetical protein